MLGWLVGYTLASIAAAFVIVRIFDYLFAGATGNIATAARLGLFVATWTAVTAKSGMHVFTTQVRQLKQSSAGARNWIDARIRREIK
jgi:hypothetical protein